MQRAVGDVIAIFRLRFHHAVHIIGLAADVTGIHAGERVFPRSILQFNCRVRHICPFSIRTVHTAALQFDPNRCRQVVGKHLIFGVLPYLFHSNRDLLVCRVGEHHLNAGYRLAVRALLALTNSDAGFVVGYWLVIHGDALDIATRFGVFRDGNGRANRYPVQRNGFADLNINFFGYFLAAQAADVRVLHGKGVRFTLQSLSLFVRHLFGDAQRAGFDFVDEFHLQLGELVCTIRVTVRAEHDGFFRLLVFFVAVVLDLPSVFACARLVLFHTAIIRGCAIALHFLLRGTIYKVNCAIVHAFRDELAVLVDFPGGVIQVRVGVFLQRDITAAPELIRKGDDFTVLQGKLAFAVHRVGLFALAGGILRPDRVHQLALLYRAIVLDGILLGRKADAGAAACIRCCRLVQCGIMGRPVFDADRELLAGGIRDVALQRFANPGRIDLFFHLQLVMIREVERHRHVGLPHTALHVVHGKGVLGVLGKRHRFFALPVELIIITIKSYVFGAVQRLIILVVAGFDVADVGCNGVFFAARVLAKLQQTLRFCMGTADIQHQLVINEHPHIIIAGEEEPDGDFLIFSYYDLAVLCQRKVKLQFSTVTVVVLDKMIACILVEGEEAVAVSLTIYCITISGVSFFSVTIKAVKVIAVFFVCIFFQIQRRLVAIIVPILRFAFLGIAVCPIKNVLLLKRERNILVDLAQYSLCRVFSGQKFFIKVRFCQICSVQGRVMIFVSLIAYQALEGTRIKAIFSSTLYINDCIVDCHKRIIQITRFSAFVTPSI